MMDHLITSLSHQSPQAQLPQAQVAQTRLTIATPGEMDQRIHTAAQEFTSVFFNQFVEEMFRSSDMGVDESAEKEFYLSFLAQGMANHLARSPSAEAFVTQIEEKMRAQMPMQGSAKIERGYPPLHPAAYAAVSMPSSTQRMEA